MLKSDLPFTHHTMKKKSERSIAPNLIKTKICVHRTKQAEWESSRSCSIRKILMIPTLPVLHEKQHAVQEICVKVNKTWNKPESLS